MWKKKGTVGSLCAIELFSGGEEYQAYTAYPPRRDMVLLIAPPPVAPGLALARQNFGVVEVLVTLLSITRILTSNFQFAAINTRHGYDLTVHTHRVFGPRVPRVPGC